VHGLRQIYYRLKNYFARTRWYPYVMRLMSKLVLFHLEIVLILTQDGCTVCTECTIGSEIILDAPDGTPRCRGSANLVLDPLELVLVLVQDRCMVCTKRTIGSESFWMHLIVLQGDEAHVEARFGPFGDSANLDAR
jgi:hypothetical protein